MAELLIKNSSVGFIKAVIFDKDGTLSNSEEFLLELAKTRIKFFEDKEVLGEITIVIKGIQEQKDVSFNKN